jgi:crossover junction endodeoxyribonuclease RuvC
MFDSCVLGVDPGVANLGLAAVARTGRAVALVWAGTVRTTADTNEAGRLRRLADAVADAIATHDPDSVAIERAGVPVQEYGPNEVKMAVTGAGNADKRQVRDALVRIHRLREVPEQPDAADAVAIALTHLMGSRMLAAARPGST